MKKNQNRRPSKEINVISHETYPLVSFGSVHNLEGIYEQNVSVCRGMVEITQISVPIMVSFSMSFILLATAILAGRLNDDEDHVAATALITAIANSVSAIIFGPLFSVGLITSQLYGEYLSRPEDEGVSSDYEVIDAPRSRTDIADQMAHYNKNGVMLAAATFAIPTLILALSDPILEAIGQDKNVSKITQEYLRIFSIGMFGWGWRVVNEQVLFALRKQKPVAVACVTNFGITTALASLSAFGVSDFPRMGLRGVALGYTVEAYLTPLILTSYALFQQDCREIGFFRKCNFNLKRDFEQVAKIATIAFPMFLSFLNEFGVQLIMNNLMGILGKKELAAQNFMSQFFFFAYFPLISYGVATSQEFSRMLGESRYRDAHNYAIGGCLSVGLTVSALSLVVSLYPKSMTYLLINKDGVDQPWFELLRGIAPIGAIGVVFDAIGFNMLQVLRAGGDNAVSSSVSAASLWGGIIAGAALGFKTNYRAYGLSVGYTGGLIMRSCLLALRWHQMIKQENLVEIKKKNGNSFFNKGYCRSLFFCCHKKNNIAELSTENERQSLLSRK